jgi:hypothetical protein
MTKDWILRAGCSGELPAVRCGPRYVRFHPQDLEDWIDRRRRQNGQAHWEPGVRGGAPHARGQAGHRGSREEMVVFEAPSTPGPTRWCWTAAAWGRWSCGTARASRNCRGDLPA